MSIQEQMNAARAYIQRKQYADARRLLKTIDHPKAKDWLVKINEIEPEPPMLGPFYEKDVWSFGIVVFVSLVLGSVTAVLYYNAGAIKGDHQSLTTWIIFSGLYAVFIAVGRHKWKQQKQKKPNHSE